jgi:hypothetical protein
MLGMAGYWLAGLWVWPVTRYYLMCLPVAAAATLLGRVVNRRLARQPFVRYVHILLIFIGIILLCQSLVR